MTKCGIAAIGLDQIVPFDARLKAQIWSWAENEPNNLGGEDCAVQRNDGRFYDVSCSNLYNVACRILYPMIGISQQTSIHGKMHPSLVRKNFKECSFPYL